MHANTQTTDLITALNAARALYDQEDSKSTGESTLEKSHITALSVRRASKARRSCRATHSYTRQKGTTTAPSVRKASEERDSWSDTCGYTPERNPIGARGARSATHGQNTSGSIRSELIKTTHKSTESVQRPMCCRETSCMSDWQSLKECEGEEWWELAYKLFLESDPKGMILNHSELYLKGDKWNDYGFRYDTLVPPTGTFRDVSKKAILVVISRARRMNWHDWKDLDRPFSKSDVQDLDEKDKKLINCVINLIYTEDGSPRPFNRYC